MAGAPLGQGLQQNLIISYDNSLNGKSLLALLAAGLIPKNLSQKTRTL